MAKRYSLTVRKVKAKTKPQKKHYWLAAKRIAFKQATLTASVVTTITAVGYFMALSEFALLLWGIEFFIVLLVSYQVAFNRLREISEDLLNED